MLRVFPAGRRSARLDKRVVKFQMYYNNTLRLNVCVTIYTECNMIHRSRITLTTYKIRMYRSRESVWISDSVWSTIEKYFTSASSQDHNFLMKNFVRHRFLYELWPRSLRTIPACMQLPSKSLSGKVFESRTHSHFAFARIKSWEK